jgi:peptidoglycan-associated lipoprotein
MLSSFRTISAFLLSSFLVINLGACSTQEATTEESIQSSEDSLAAAPPKDAEKATDDAKQQELDKAFAEASSTDFTDPNDVQLNGSPNSASGDTPSSIADSSPSADSSLSTASVDDMDSTIPAPEAPDLTSDTSDTNMVTNAKSMTVYFGKSSSRVSREFRAELKELAAKLKADRSLKIHISGHCDSRGSPVFNRRLALKRAKAVKSYLVKLGVKSNQVHVSSFGKDKLVQAGESEQEHRMNRRVELEFQ